MRVSWHHEAGTVVISLWAGRRCRATFRMPREDVPGLVAALTDGLQSSEPTIELPPARTGEYQTLQDGADDNPPAPHSSAG